MSERKGIGFAYKSLDNAKETTCFNVAVLAYGQTGSGKTFSMGTCPSTNRADQGHQRAIMDMFTNIESDDEWLFNVGVSFLEGSENRTTGATAMNAQSSRSHAIFTIYIRQTNKSDEGLKIGSNGYERPVVP